MEVGQRFYGSEIELIDDACMENVRKGPWTTEEDSVLFNYINTHGEGRWNYVARCTGLKRTGKSCRLRWLNYLRPTVRRGNITLQEQLLILELHFRWGNRWSKIAQFLPGRTDNEIKNYWRTRVQKQAKQLKCDVNSKQFRDAMRYVWIPRLLERIHAAKGSESHTDRPVTDSRKSPDYPQRGQPDSVVTQSGSGMVNPVARPEMLATPADSAEVQVSSVSDATEVPELQGLSGCGHGSGFREESPQSEWIGGWLVGNDSLEGLLNDDDDMWFLQNDLFDNF